MNSQNEEEPGRTSDVPAVFRYRPFLDFLADATFQHRHAVDCTDDYTANRYARAAIISAAFSIESLANCLIADLDLDSEEFNRVERFGSMEKIAHFFRERRLQGFGKGDKQAQRCAELLRLRDAYVHPKSFPHPAAVAEPVDAGAEWVLPMSVSLEMWPLLKISKTPIAWRSPDSERALKTVFSFHEYVLRNLIKHGAEELEVLLASRMEFSGAGIVLPLDNSMKKEFTDGASYGLRINRLGMTKLVHAGNSSADPGP